MLRGNDPHRHLTTTDVLERAVTQRALQRAVDLREQEIELQAHRTIELLCEALDSD